MSQDVYKRLRYLQQISEQLQKSDPNNCGLSSLISFYGKESKEIQFKNQIKSFGWDVLKLSRCKKCHALFNFDNITSTRNEKQLIKVKKGVLKIVCGNCDFGRKYPVNKERHTKYEQLIFDRKLKSRSNGRQVEKTKNSKQIKKRTKKSEEKSTAVQNVIVNGNN